MPRARRARSFVVATLCSLAMVTTAVTPAASAAGAPVLTSDAFSAASVDTSVWSVGDPVGDGSIGVADGRLLLGVPAGVSHDLWQHNRSVRLMQSVGGDDFEVELKLDSVPTQQFQIQGLLVEQDAHNWMRFDTFHDGTGLHSSSVVTVDGRSQERVKKPISTSSSSLWLRVARSGPTWSWSWSDDGESFAPVGSVTQPMDVQRIGPFAGNAGRPASTSPAFTSRVDYLWNLAEPFPGEEPAPSEPEPEPTAPEPEPEPEPVPSEPEPEPVEAVRVMAVGDSLTAGTSGVAPGSQGTYRYYLQQQLAGAGTPFAFVGPYGSHPTGSYLDQGGWDHDSFSVAGWRLVDMQSQIQSAVSTHDPDVLLVLAGVNDLMGGKSVSDVSTYLYYLVTKSRYAQRDVDVVLGLLPPNTRLDAQLVSDYNARLVEFAASFDTERSRVVIADLHTGVDVDAHLFDGLHPNDAGDRLLASRFAHTLSTDLDIPTQPAG